MSKCLELGCFSKRCIRFRKRGFCVILPRDLWFLYSECGNWFLRAVVLGQPDWQHCINSKVNLTSQLRPNNAPFKAQTAGDGTILCWATAELQIFTVCWGFMLELLSDNSTNACIWTVETKSLCSLEKYNNSVGDTVLCFHCSMLPVCFGFCGGQTLGSLGKMK